MPTYKLLVEFEGVRKPMIASLATITVEASDPYIAFGVYNAFFSAGADVYAYYGRKTTITRNGKEITPSELECDVSDFKAQHWADFSKR